VTESTQELVFDHYDDGFVRCPYPVLAQLRSNSPVAWSDAHGGFWLASTMETVRALALSPEVFSSRYTSVPKDIGLGDVLFPPVQLDPPDHTRMKKLLLPSFSAERSESLREYTRGVVVDLLTKILDGGDHFDASEDFARLVPTAVVCKLLGLPGEISLFTGWVRRMLEQVAINPQDAAIAGAEIFGYVNDVVLDRRENPGEDVISHMLATEVDGESLEDVEVVFAALVLVFAGIDTTWSTLGSTIHHLATHPEQQRHLREHPEGMELAREEFLRAFAPVAPARIVATDTEVNGTRLSKGDMVLVSFPSANRDEHEFEDSDEVVLDRSPNRHLTFGVGVHRCLGVHIARMELEVALQEFLRMVPDFTLAEPDKVEWSRGQVRGPRKLVLKVGK
jgi:cytochrome P450